jgi:hypothetical protein
MSGGGATPVDALGNQGALLEHMAANLVRNSDVSINVGANVIITTEDKIKLAVRSHLDRMSKKDGWIAPLGLLVAIVITFPTTEFKKFVLPADSWLAIFAMGALASGIWFVIAVVRALRAPTEDDFIATLCVPPNELEQVAPTNPPSTGLRTSVTPPGTSMWSQVGRWLAEQQRGSLRDVLLTKKWTLIFNPPAGHKAISFNADGTIGSGRNHNEDRWELIGERLTLINPGGEVHSRFEFDWSDRRWSQVNSIDTPRARDQRIVERS